VKWGFLAVLAALVVAAPATAAPPAVHARAWFVQSATTGEVLAQHGDRARMPIASITKLMTVLVTLEHAKLDDVVTVEPSASEVGESTINLLPGERITVREVVEGALIQSANDAANALAEYVGKGDTEAFVTLMNAKARELVLRDTLFVRPAGLDVAGHVSSARDVTKLAQILMHDRIVRSVVRARTATISGGRTLHTWNDLLGQFPGLLRVQTGHTGAAGWCEVAAARGPGVTIYVAVLGSPTRSSRNADLAELLRYGLSRYRLVSVIAERPFAWVETGYGKSRLELIPSRPLRRSVRVGVPLVERVVAPGVVGLPVHRGQQLGEVRVYARGRLLGSRPLVAARDVSRPGLASRVGWYAGRAAHHLGTWFS
jgi:D-alanyl-D-alanine carboxypeptidase (penicillin-binding protein 5/6)